VSDVTLYRVRAGDAITRLSIRRSNVIDAVSDAGLSNAQARQLGSLARLLPEVITTGGARRGSRLQATLPDGAPPPPRQLSPREPSVRATARSSPPAPSPNQSRSQSGTAPDVEGETDKTDHGRARSHEADERGTRTRSVPSRITREGGPSRSAARLSLFRPVRGSTGWGWTGEDPPAGQRAEPCWLGVDHVGARNCLPAASTQPSMPASAIPYRHTRSVCLTAERAPRRPVQPPPLTCWADVTRR
jgi:hypothetical protein